MVFAYQSLFSGLIGAHLKLLPIHRKFLSLLFQPEVQESGIMDLQGPEEHFARRYLSILRRRKSRDTYRKHTGLAKEKYTVSCEIGKQRLILDTAFCS